MLGVGSSDFLQRKVAPWGREPASEKKREKTKKEI